MFNALNSTFMKNKIIPSSQPGISYLDHGKAGKPITIIGNEFIVSGLEDQCIQQALNSRNAPGVKELILNPDAHVGYGVPVGSVMVTDGTIYPAPAGVDVNCSMSLLQLDVPASELKDKKLRRRIITEILKRVGLDGENPISRSLIEDQEFRSHVIGAIQAGANQFTLKTLGIPAEWIDRCEDSSHGNRRDFLMSRYNWLSENTFKHTLHSKLRQLGSIGGGNHFVEMAEVQKVSDSPEFDAFGLKEGKTAILSHFGSRGFGNSLATDNFHRLQERFKTWHQEYPAGDKELVFAPLDSQEAKDYILDMQLAANFAIMNHLYVNKLLLDSIKEVIPGVTGEFIYHISHNIGRQEIIDNRKLWVLRKGATRAYPAKHFSLKNTPFYETGHPILLPGNAKDGSYVMVGLENAVKTAYSINHGAGRTMSRTAATKSFSQEQVNKDMNDADIIFQGTDYPIDESSFSYKPFDQVINSVEIAGLAKKVAKLKPLLVIKGK